MAPRRYRLTTRAASAAATRERIVRAAAAEYREIGVATSSIRAIAARAEVSRGTVLHHFGDAGGLLGAVLDDLVVSLDIPDGRLLQGAANMDERARRFVDAMLRFYDRTSDWWTVYGSQIDHPVVHAREVDFWKRIAGFRAAAFGRAADDRIVTAVIDTLTHPATLGTMQTSGLSLNEAIDVTGDLVVGLLRRHGLAGP
jgi:AcrR family transcriptional regulator